MSRIFGLDSTSSKLKVKFKHEIIMSLESVKTEFDINLFTVEPLKL